MLTGIIKVLNALVNRVAERQAFKNNFPSLKIFIKLPPEKKKKNESL